MGSKSKRLKMLGEVANNGTAETELLSPALARMQPIIFSFKRFDKSRNSFECVSRYVDGIIFSLDMLKLFSQVERSNLERGFPNCHQVPDDQISKHNLHDLVTLSPSKRLHQLGKHRTPERIVGYFDSPLTNLFQVCFFDLKHNLSGD